MRLICAIALSFTLVAHGELVPSSPRKAPQQPKPETTLPKVEAPAEAPKKVEAPAAATKSAASGATASAPAASSGNHAIVQKWDKRKERMAITDDPKRPWTRGDNVCAFRMGRALACGKVIAIGLKGAVVQLASHTAAVKPGDEARYYEPEKVMPQITDEEIFAEGLMEAKPYTYNVTLGYSLSLDLMHPIAHFYYAVSPIIAVGIQPAYISKTKTEAGGDSTLSGFGGVLTVNYFSQEYFRGLWLQLGSGFYHLSAKPAGGVEETLNVPNLSFLGGWREDWAHGLNVGAVIGARFLSPLITTTSEVKYNSLNGVAQFEVGWSF